MINFIKSAKRLNEFPDSNLEVVFIGRSNVGKSSLINALYKNNLAYVGKTPGKTRLLNFFNINDQYTVCDVPGYGFANRNYDELIEFGDMMEDYFDNRKCLKLCVLILDIRRIPNEDDLDMLEYLRNKKQNILIVLNKIDKLSNNQLVKAKKDICNALNMTEDKFVLISAFKKTNIELLKEKINNLI